MQKPVDVYTEDGTKLEALQFLDSNESGFAFFQWLREKEVSVEYAPPFLLLTKMDDEDYFLEVEDAQWVVAHGDKEDLELVVMSNDMFLLNYPVG